VIGSFAIVIASKPIRLALDVIVIMTKPIVIGSIRVVIAAVSIGIALVATGKGVSMIVTVANGGVFGAQRAGASPPSRPRAARVEVVIVAGEAST
jgi:hypothetical protein